MPSTTYGMVALAGELDRLARAVEGERNDTLNPVWFKLVQLAEAGHLDRDEAYQRTYDTAREIGLTDREIRATMASAERGGQAKPRTNVPDPSSNGAAGRGGLLFDPFGEFGTDTAASSATQGEAPSPLEFSTLAELRARVAAAGPRKWLLRGIWPAGDYGVHAAEMKAHKTWNAVDLVVSVASGTSWLGGIEVDLTGPVIMFAGEGSEANLVRRINAVCASRDLDADTLPIVVCTRAPKLNANPHIDAMQAKIAEVRPVLVTLDPLYLAARGAKLGDLYAMGELLERAQHVCQGHGAALFVVHHHNRNDGATGPLRISGAGPAEWGRVLITGKVKSRRADPDTAETTVVTELEVIGGEVAGGIWRVIRKVRADDPADLDSELHYEVRAAEREPDDDNGDDPGMPPVRRKLLEALRSASEPRTIKQLQDWLADSANNPDGIVPKRTTCSEHLNALLTVGLADEIDPGPGRAKLWVAVDREGVSAEPVEGVATPDR